MIRTQILLFGMVLAIGIFVPQLGILLLVSVLVLGAAGLLWTYSNPFDRRRRGGRR